MVPSRKMHIRNDHSYFLQHAGNITEKSNSFSCKICFKCFGHRGSLYNHLKRIHKLSSIGLKTVRCLEENCSESFKTTSKLMSHLNKYHCKTFILEELIFESLDDFKLWKQETEKNTKTGYIWYAQNITADNTLIYYKCSRSGFYKEKPASDKRIRKLKSQGSKKSGAHCTSKIVIKIDSETKAVKVKFCRTHYGHKMELVHVKNNTRF